MVRNRNPEKLDHEDSKCGFKFCMPVRFILAIISFLGMAVMYALRVNLSVAIVKMTNLTYPAVSSNDSECPVVNATHKHTHNLQNFAEFDWDSTEVGHILGAFFYGYILTQMISGYLTNRIGGKLVLGIGILSTSLLTLLIPVAARAGLWYLFAIRFLQGLSEGVTFPAMHDLWGKWAPEMERSKLVTFVYSGINVGNALALPLSGALANSDFLGGWPSIFYVFGVVGCLWVIVWMLLASNSAAEHPRISDAEREYIQQSVGSNKVMVTPWRSILTSVPVMAICVAHACNNWTFYTMLTCLPLYMKTILHLNIEENSQLSAIPYVLLWILVAFAGIVADFLYSNGYLSITATRKLMNVLGMVIPAILMCLIKFVGCSTTGALTLVILSVIATGFSLAGFQCNHLDVAPNYAGILMGLSNTIATIPGFLGPYIVGVLTDTKDVREGWQTVFYISAGINLFGAIFYVIFGSGEQQAWSIVNDNEDKPIWDPTEPTESRKTN